MKKLCFQISLLAAVCAQAGSTHGESISGYREAEMRPLFNGRDLEGWVVVNDARFSVREGSLYLEGGSGWLRSSEVFDDFHLTVRFRFLEEGANSGIFVRTEAASPVDPHGWPDNGFQVQLLDSVDGPYPLGSLIPYGGEVMSRETDSVALRTAYREAGVWQEMEIICHGEQLIVRVNGERITRARIESRSAHIGIQGEFGRLEFSRIEVARIVPDVDARTHPVKDAEISAALASALEAPEILLDPGSPYTADSLDYAMVIGTAQTPGGRIWAAWVAGGDDHNGLFVTASSDDGGRTWQSPRLVIDPPNFSDELRRRILVGNFWSDPLGRLWLFFDQSIGYFDGRAGAWFIRSDDPDADTPQWTPPRRVWHGATLCKPIILANGEWLKPVSLWTREWIRPPALEGGFPELDPLRGAHVFVSHDDGETWIRRGAAKADQRRFDEHMMVELKDGRIWMLIRTYYGIAESFSSDRGRSWSEPVPSRFQHVRRGSRIFFRRLASGNLLLVKHGAIDEQTPNRSRLMAFLSKDEGETWSNGLLLDERSGVSYPDGFQCKEGAIHIIYDRNRSSDREILMARFTEEDVFAGEMVSGAGFKKQIVHKALKGLEK